MLYVSILQSDRERDPELWATLWQGEAPKGLEFIAVYNLQNDTRVFVTKADPPQLIGWLDRFNAVENIITTPAFDRTDGWQDGATSTRSRSASPSPTGQKARNRQTCAVAPWKRPTPSPLAASRWTGWKNEGRRVRSSPAELYM